MKSTDYLSLDREGNKYQLRLKSPLDMLYTDLYLIFISKVSCAI